MITRLRHAAPLHAGRHRSIARDRCHRAASLRGRHRRSDTDERSDRTRADQNGDRAGFMIVSDATTLMHARKQPVSGAVKTRLGR
jgi:hypothetical protein